MVFRLYPEHAPITVENFVKTARSGFYDGLCWCRIVEGYVIQAGSPDNDIMTDSDWHIKGEFAENGVNNPLQHIRGALSMARDDGFDTAGTQFLWCTATPISWTAAMRPSARWSPALTCWTPSPPCPPTAPKPGTNRWRCR